jgi:hypothetical protein
MIVPQVQGPIIQQGTLNQQRRHQFFNATLEVLKIGIEIKTAIT